jgi:hypothetical protein
VANSKSPTKKEPMSLLDEIKAERKESEARIINREKQRMKDAKNVKN